MEDIFKAVLPSGLLRLSCESDHEDLLKLVEILLDF